jgi:putative hemolysin
MKAGNTLFYLLAFMLLVAAAACQGAAKEQDTEAPITGMANPSAVYCEGLGYSSETVTRNGGEDADCIFPDDSRCPAWDFLAGRGTSAPASSTTARPVTSMPISRGIAPQGITHSQVRSPR